jgi:hypothetical protein
MKSSLFALLLIVSSISFSQNLADKISKTATYVFTINGGPTLEQVSANEISASRVFEEMIHEFFRGHGKIQSLDQMGIDYEERIFFVGEYQEDVSMSYMSYKIKDAAAFEAMVKNTEFETEFTEKDGMKILSYDSENKLIWKDDIAILISAYYVGQEYNEWSWYEDEYYLYDEIAEAVEEVQPALEDMTQEEWEAYMAEQDKKREEERKKREEERERKRKEKEEKRRKRDEIVSNSINNRAKTYFSDELLNNKENLSIDLNEDANATFWYPNYISFVNPLMYGMAYPAYGYGRYGMFGTGLFGMTNMFNGEMVVDLYLEEDEIRMDGKMKYFGDLREAYSKIFSQKINSSFTKMISDKDLGYTSISASSKDFLDEYPKVIENLLNVYDTTYSEEYELFGDLFSIAVDEEAISELVTGDALFIFHDMGMKSVEYYSYDYDENYNYTKTLKTRMQLVPDFSFIFGTNRQDIMNRFVRLGLKYELLEKIDGGYMFKDVAREFGFNVYASVQNDFVIFSNSKSELKTIVEGKVESPIAGDKKKDVAKNTAAAYFNIKEFMTEMLLTDEIRDRDKEFFNSLKDDLDDASASMHFEKDGSVFEASAPVPAGHKNSSLYLLHTIDKMINHFDRH